MNVYFNYVGFLFKKSMLLIKKKGIFDQNKKKMHEM